MLSLSEDKRMRVWA